MANIRGITVEINGDTTKLSKALEGVDKNIRNTQSQLKDVEKLLKLDPTNTELLAQKQRLLGEAVKDTKERLEALKTASEKAAETKDNYDDWKAKYDPIKKEINETTEELEKLKKQSEDAGEQLSNGKISQEEYDNLQNKVKETSDKLKDLKKSAEDVSEEFGRPISPEQYEAIQREIIDTEHELQNLQREAENSRTSLVEIGKAGEGLQNIGNKISGAGEALMPVTAAIAGIGTAGALSFAEVDKTMQLANKTMDNTVEEAEAVNTAMKEAAANSVYGMSDAANAVLNFARAGLKAEPAISALTPAMNLAAGEGGDLDTVSAGLVATLNGFHAEFDEAGRYADIFASACNNSALDVNSLSEAMSVAAPIFSAAGYEIEDATLAMGLMGNAGIDASTSANSLKTGIARLIDTTKEGEVALSSMGFGTADVAEQEAKLLRAQNLLEEKSADMTAKQLKYNEALAKYGEGSSQVASAQAALIKAENNLEQAQNAVNVLTKEASEGTSAYGDLMVDEYGKMRPFEEVLEKLQRGFSGLSEAEQISAASAIFGKNQMTPWLALLNTSEEDVNDLSTALHNSAGTTQEMADTMMGGFGGGIEKLKSSIDVLIYNIGESLAPILQKAIDCIQGLVDKFNALSPQTKETITKIALIVAAIGPLLIVVGKLTSGIGGVLTTFSKIPAIMTKVKGAFTVVKTAIMGISAPAVAIAAVIAVLVAAFVNLWKNNEDFRNNIIAIWDGIKATFERLTSGIVDRLNALGFDFEDFTETLKYLWDWFCNYLAPIFENVFKYIGDIFSDVVDVILGIVDFFIGLFTGNWEQCWNGIKEIFTGIWDAIVNTVVTIIEIILNIFNTNLADFCDVWETGWNDIKEFFSDVWNGIKDFFVNVWNDFQDNFQSGMDIICDTFTTIWTAIKNFFVGIWKAISKAVSNAVNSVKNVITTIFTAVKNFITTVFTAIHNTISAVWNAVYTTVKPLLDAFAYLFETIFEAIKILIGRAMDWISEKIHA
ncbi:MAG: phage tail tape measure protein, partial [Ruminococcus sp.]|nr:phage tail tape measure protein [Ruminococcus sp.]